MLEVCDFATSVGPVHSTTALPVISDSDFMFCLQNYQGFIINRPLVYKFYPQDRINKQVIDRFALAQVKCTRECLPSYCKHSITSLSFLVGTIVGEHKSDLADILFVLLTANPLKLPETKNWLLQEELKQP